MAVGVVFCAGASFLGDTSLWMGAVAQSWVPYVAVPFAMGFIGARLSVVRAGVLGALSCSMLIGAFYLAGNPARTGSYSVDTGSMVSEYGLLSLVTGFTMAALARAIAPRVAVAPWRWTVAFCSFLTLAVIVSWLVLGWGAQDVATASGVVITGTSTLDVVLSSTIVLAFSYGVIVFAVVGMPESRSRQRRPHDPRRRDHDSGRR